jgi:FAD/FMN-containing dehydrogenase
LDDPADLAKYETGWRYGAGKAAAVARPSTVEEVSSFLRHCFEQGIRVIPQGANTGLVGASTPDGSGTMVVLSLERLNRRLEISPADRTVLVDGGVLLSRLNEALAEHGLLFPVDLGADPMVGAMVATNTGGTRLLRYGDVRRNLLGAEVVLADGTILDGLTALRKNNTGLDAKQLFTGTTGLFGVVTAAVLQVVPIPRQRVTALVGLSDAESVLALLTTLEGQVSELLSAFEVISVGALEPVFRHQTRLRNPFGSGTLPPFAALVELSTTLPAERLDLTDLLESTLGAHLESDAGAGITDVYMAPPEDLWEIRHHVSESLRGEGKVLGLDIAVPRSALPAFRESVRTWLAEDYPSVRLCDFGHWGDGGVHLNLVWNESEASSAVLIPCLQQKVYDLAVVRFRGSYSAEHGVGPHNQRFFDTYTEEPVKALGALLKDHLDPKAILGTTRLW